MKRNEILIGDVREQLRELDSASVDCIVTSPPYFGLRDYGRTGQLGAEHDVAEWVAELRSVARQLARVLRPHGTWWLNVGDSYSAHPREGARRKALLLGPQRLAVGLAEDGWLIRNQIVWAKPNAMPSSIPDRLSTTYETVFLLTRAPQYYFDLDAIRVPALSRHTSQTKRQVTGYPPPSAIPPSGLVDRNQGLDRMKLRGASSHPLGKNPGDVWTIATANYRGAHFATYPQGLAERAVLAGCPARVCAQCHTPWKRRSERHVEHGDRLLATGILQPQCACKPAWQPGLVLDPFIGSGTTALAAEDLDRDWLGIELNPDFAAMAQERITAHRQKRSKDAAA